MESTPLKTTYDISLTYKYVITMLWELFIIIKELFMFF